MVKDQLNSTILEEAFRDRFIRKQLVSFIISPVKLSIYNLLTQFTKKKMKSFKLKSKLR